MFLDSKESLKDHEVLIDAFINNKAKLSRKDFIERLKHVKFIRTRRNTNYLSFYISSFEDYDNLQKFHDVVNKGKFDFDSEYVFAIAIQPKLYNWFKTTDYLTIEKQIVSWLTGLYLFTPEKRSIMESQIYKPLFEEIIKLKDKYYCDYEVQDFKKLTKALFDEYNEHNVEILAEEIAKAERKYLDVCQEFYNSIPPEFLNSPFGYEHIEGWGLTESNPFDHFSFEIIQSYFREDDWKRVFEKGEYEDDMHRVESRGDLWEKWKHTFGTFDKRNNFVYSFFYSSENSNDIQQKRKKRETIPQAVRDIVWKRDGGICVECGSNEKLEYDHIIPFSKGGSSTYRNLRLLCENCNRKKHNKI